MNVLWQLKDYISQPSLCDRSLTNAMWMEMDVRLREQEFLFSL